MKAVCLVLCLALAGEISASLFNFRPSKLEDFEPIKYIHNLLHKDHDNHQKQTPEPQRQTPEHNRRTPRPHYHTPKPHRETPVPYEQTPELPIRKPEPLFPPLETSMPHRETAEPQEQTSEPRRQTPEPYEQTPEFPIRIPGSLGDTLMPQKETPEPYEQTPEPHRQTPQPYEQTPEAHRQTPEPYEQTPEVHRLTPEPYEQTPEAHKQTPEPYEETPEFPIKVPGPNYETSLYNRKTPEPYEKTPEPHLPYDQTPEPYRQTLKPQSQIPEHVQFEMKFDKDNDPFALLPLAKDNSYLKTVSPDQIKSPSGDDLNRVRNSLGSPYGDAVSWKGIEMAVSSLFNIDQEDFEHVYLNAQNSIKHLTEEEKQKFHADVNNALKKNNEDVKLNATELLKKYQYPVEEHVIKTDDGYLLTLIHISSRKQPRYVQSRGVVLLMHGLEGSCDDWVIMGPGKSLAFLLSDAGYDVWLGNARGNKYSSRHVSKHPAIDDFWNFSIDEIALHDLPAMIDYILLTTKQSKLQYVGHTLGSTVFFALAAALPEYNDKISMMHALSPMVYMSHIRSPLFRMMSPTSDFYDRVQDHIGNGVFDPPQELLNTLGGALCQNEFGCKNVCSELNFVMNGFNAQNMDTDMIPMIMSHLPAGMSSKLVRHYGQNVASLGFRMFDYGAVKNKQVYGQRVPPSYRIEEVRAPVSLYYSQDDWLAHPKDITKLANELPNMKAAYKYPGRYFSNMDFQFSPKAVETVYYYMFKYMQEL